MVRYINVTLGILRKYSSSKSMKELLALAMWMKMQHSNSVIWNVSVHRLTTELHIGKTKARRLIHDMKDDDLFSVNGSSVAVSTFRDHTTKWTRKGKSYHGAVVCKFEVKEYTLKELYNLINERLFELQICAAEHKDCFMKDKKETSSAKGYAITTMQFGEAISMSAGSVSTIKKRLVGKGRINSTLAEKHSFDKRDAEDKRRVLQRTGKKKEDFVIGDFGYVVVPCFYSVANREVSDEFRHRIYGKQNNIAIQKTANFAGLPDGFYC